MGNENGIIAEWISPCKIKRYVVLNAVIVGLLAFVRLISVFHKEYELSREVFLDGNLGEEILKTIFLLSGGIGFVLGIALTVIGLLGLKAEMDGKRVLTLLLAGNINMLIAVLMIIK